ncbi:MAG: coproporphyrinogen III oxidase, partial [Hyphomicrobiales bacterium]
MASGPAAPGDIGVYIHWPFCLAKCPYCDFNSHVADHAPDIRRWQAALLSELSALAARVPARRLTSIFFGGGTPSLMEPELAAALIAQIKALWPYEDDLEITLEANPTSAEAGRFADFARAGVNRLSLGVQALNDRDLKRLGRRHSAAEALAALEMGQGLFPRSSFDLIYARPGQSLEDWAAELEKALRLARGHISLYQLTIEEGTAFYEAARQGRLKLPGEARADDLYALTRRMCEAAGLPAYEISNHAAPGEESRHNLNYWRGGDYLGIGPGAHSRLAGHALATARDPASWLERVEQNGSGLTTDETLTALARAEERLLMGLRLAEGLDLAALTAETGHRIQPQVLRALAGDGLLAEEGDRLRATRAGQSV